MKYFVCVLLAMTSVFALAETSLPKNKPIEVVVPFPPGGATDSLGRFVAEILTENGRPARVINKPGADTVIGANYAAKARPDGKTLFIGTTGSLDANFAFPTVGMEYTDQSFVPIVELATISYVLIVSETSPIKNYEQFKSYVRSNPDRFNLAFWNANTANIFYDWARRENLPRPNIIIYKGSTPQMQDVIGGHVTFAWDTWFAVSPQLQGNKVRILATMTKDAKQDIKKINPNDSSIVVSDTVPELNINVWYGLWAPAGTPQAQLTEINRILNRAFQQPKYKEKMQALNIKFSGGTTEALAATQKRNLRILERLAQTADK